jgi:putative transposase
MSYLKTIVSQITKDVKVELVEFNGEEDHIHMIVKYPPTLELSKLVGLLKGKSASAFLDKFGSQYWGAHQRTLWSSGYFLCSVGGATLEVLRAYIENQGH